MTREVFAGKNLRIHISFDLLRASGVQKRPAFFFLISRPSIAAPPKLKHYSCLWQYFDCSVSILILVYLDI